VAAKIQRVQVTRSFRHRGDDYGTGSVLDVDLPTAQELRSAKKAEFVESNTSLAKLPLPAKKDRPTNRGNAQQIVALSAQVAELKALVEKLSPAKPAAKEKASA